MGTPSKHMLSNVCMGMAVRRLRHDAGLTLAEIDDKLGFAKGGQLGREQGRTKLGAAEMFAFCAAVGCRSLDVWIEARARGARTREPSSALADARRELASVRAAKESVEVDLASVRAELSAVTREVDW